MISYMSFVFVVCLGCAFVFMLIVSMFYVVDCLWFNIMFVVLFYSVVVFSFSVLVLLLFLPFS